MPTVPLHVLYKQLKLIGMAIGGPCAPCGWEGNKIMMVLFFAGNFNDKH